MPSKHNALECWFLQWSAHKRSQIVFEREIHEMFDEWLDKEKSKKKQALAVRRGKQNSNTYYSLHN